MKVKMLTIMAGPDGSFHPNDVVDFPTVLAKDLVSKGFAVPVAPATKTTKKAVQISIEEQAAKVEEEEEIDEDELEKNEDRKEKR